MSALLVHMKCAIKFSILFCVSSLLMGLAAANAGAAQVTIDFAKGLQGCVGGFADYPVDPAQQEIYELGWGLEASPVAPKKTSFMITGTNRSDDLFMFGKCYVDAKLKPGSLHKIAFEITAAVDVPYGCSGVGGSPDALTLKAGASLVEPRAVSDGGDGIHEMYVLNLDKGNQTNGGSDLAVISKTLNNGLNCEDDGADQFKSVVKRSSVATGFTADARGGFWIVWGTDSGFESTSTIYYQKLSFDIQ